MKMKKIAAIVLAGTMIMGMSLPVSAQVPQVGTGTEGNGATVSIKKNLEMAGGLDIPESTFEFEITKITQDAPEATIEKIGFNNKDEKGNADAGKYTISKTSAIQFGTFPHAGEYLYTLKEKNTSQEGITYATDVYTLRVQVANTAAQDALYVKSITAEKGTSDGQEGNKVAEILFTNTYRKNGSLTITKTTTGELADLTKKFEFTITFQKSPTEEKLADFEGKLIRKSGETETVTCTGGKASFQLAHGDKVVFENIPAGTTYTVTEAGANDGYKGSVIVIENGVKQEEISGEDKDAVVSGNHVIGENENKADFTNTYHEIAITGILMNNLPFVLLIVVAIVAFGTLAFMKRRRTSRR